MYNDVDNRLAVPQSSITFTHISRRWILKKIKKKIENPSHHILTTITE